MRKAGFVLAGLTVVAVLAARADAQQGARTPPPPPRTAGMAPAPPPPPAPVTNSPTAGGTTLTGIVLPNQIVAAALVPVFVTGDGRVYGDFGLGFEPVVRVCSAAVLSQHGFAPTGATATAPPPPRPATQGAAATTNSRSPVAGLAPVPPPPNLISVPSVAATSACWGGVNAGRIVVIR
jgi:hypothetical protein